MSLLVVLGLRVELFFEAGHSRQVLLLFQKDTVTLQVGILDTFLALIGQLLDRLFFLLVKGDALLLIL